MNRIALHQSTVHPLDPVALVEVARGAGLDSIGLRVAAAADVEPWWSRGIGSPMLPDLIEALLTHRVTVLDVGRVLTGQPVRGRGRQPRLPCEIDESVSPTVGERHEDGSDLGGDRPTRLRQVARHRTPSVDLRAR